MHTKYLPFDVPISEAWLLAGVKTYLADTLGPALSNVELSLYKNERWGELSTAQQAEIREIHPEVHVRRFFQNLYLRIDNLSPEMVSAFEKIQIRQVEWETDKKKLTNRVISNMIGLSDGDTALVRCSDGQVAIQTFQCEEIL